MDPRASGRKRRSGETEEQRALCCPEVWPGMEGGEGGNKEAGGWRGLGVGRIQKDGDGLACRGAGVAAGAGVG